MKRHIEIDYSKLSQLGERIKSRRIELDMTQKEVAEILGTHKNTIYDIERGKANLSITYLYSLANVLEISLVDLFEGIYINEKRRN